MNGSNLSDKTNDEIITWIKNHEDKGVRDTPLYKALIEERNRRFSEKLKLSTSIAFLLKAAKAKQFVGYGELAAANGAKWSNKIRMAMSGKHGHLQNILDYCHLKQWPYLTAIVVSKDHLEDGSMEESTLNGFSDGLRNLGIHIADPAETLRRCQQDVFKWAARTDPASLDINQDG